MKTELNDYTLWYDGTIEVEPSKVVEMILAGVDINRLSVTTINEEVKKFNKLSYDKPLSVKTENNIPEKTLLIPESYLSLDIDKYIEAAILPKIPEDKYYEKRLERLVRELELFEKHGMLYILKVLLFIIDTFKQQNVVWGVGRGSSCASYLLYLIGLHSIDSVKYDIPISEFIK